MLKIRNFFKRYRILMGFIILTIGISYSIHQVDVKDNKTRCEAVKLIKSLSDNTYRSSTATLKSPTASQGQKDAASKNLNEINEILITTRKVFHFPHGPECA